MFKGNGTVRLILIFDMYITYEVSNTVCAVFAFGLRPARPPGAFGHRGGLPKSLLVWQDFVRNIIPRYSK